MSTSNNGYLAALRLAKIKGVIFCGWEYPGFLSIVTAKGAFVFGNDNGRWEGYETDGNGYATSNVFDLRLVESAPPANIVAAVCTMLRLELPPVRRLFEFN